MPFYICKAAGHFSFEDLCSEHIHRGFIRAVAIDSFCIFGEGAVQYLERRIVIHLI